MKTTHLGRCHGLGLLALLTFGSGAAAAAQDPPRREERRVTTRRVVAGPQYQAGSVHRFFFGGGYRRLWTTPIEVEVLDLRTFHGGLKATKKGGGKQTKGLRFDSADGREWKFRSVDKDPTPVIPEQLQDSFVESYVRDQISASLPANGPVVDALAEAAGVLHVERRLYVLPDDPALGEFRKEFAGMLGTLEEDLRVKEPATPGFEGFKEKADTDELEKLLAADPGERLDSRAYLRARLLDAMINDYDRHRDQWEWVKDPATGRWLPVPGDRDLAFVNFDGLVLDLVRRSQPRLVKFDERYPGPLALTWQARFLDRRHLTDLDWPAWQEVAAELQARLTDAAIEEAVRKLPPPYYRLAREELVTRLKARRQALDEYARAYYELLAAQPEMHATDEPDSLDLLRAADGSVEVVAGGAKGEYFRRTFRPDDTREVRVFMKGGDDRAVSEGPGRPGVTVRLVGGEGNDLLDESASGYTRFYDAGGDNRMVEGEDTKLDTRPYAPPLDRDGNPPRDFGSRISLAPWVRAGDQGVVLGAMKRWTIFGFRKHPYARQHSLWAGYSPTLGTAGAHYEFLSRRTDNRSRLQVEARASALDLLHFHGFGNETGSEGPSDFYDVKLTRYLLAPSYRFELTAVDVFVGPFVQYSTSGDDPGTLVGLQRPYGSGRFGQAGARLGLLVDRREPDSGSGRGAMFSAEGRYFPPVWSATEGFGKVGGQAVAFVPTPLPLAPTLALRAGGQKLFGRYPFHEAATLGGDDTVRGLRRQRYTGDAAVYGNAELRLHLRKRRGVLFPRVGVFALADVGRIYFEGESSDRWHTAVGGGFWFSFMEPANVVTLSAARSEGRTRIYLQSGFMF